MIMDLRIIKTEIQYEEYLEWIDKQFDKKVKPDSPMGEKVQVALLLIKQYEDEHYPIPKPDPIEAIKIKMLELGLKNKDLVGKIGSKGYVSALLNKRKPLTLESARIFHKELQIPADVLLS
jgi:HTH-type transcriptional regulator/antitoxin HigA